MSNVLLYKDRYKEEFADCMVEKYRLSQYGIKCAKSPINCDLAYLRNEILEWAQNEDAGALTQVSVAYMSWLPVTFNGNPAAYIGGFSTAGQTSCGGPILPCNLGMSYATENGNVNIIDVNVGGCMTRINVNPNITINGGSYQYYIPTADDTWTINHNLGFVPNVLTTDISGNEISGVVTTATISTIVIEFSEPVSGYAYLS
jgi:hypothetical protein